MTAAETLRAAGFVVVEAECVDDAVGVLRERASSIGLILSDIETPGEMDGVALAHLSKAFWPHIPVVLTSGRVTPAPETLPASSRFVPKPYDLDAMTAMALDLLSA